MAYALTPRDKEQNDETIPRTAQSSPAMVNTPGASAQPGAVGANVRSSGTGGIIGPSGSFTNLSQYLESNTPQATEYAGKVSDVIGKTGMEAQSAIDKAASEFESKAAEGTQTFEGLGGHSRSSQIVGDVVNDPAAALSNAAKMEAFNRIAQGKYLGPTSLQEAGLASDVANKVGAAKSVADLGTTSGGRQELLRQVPGTRQYAQGGLALDQYLLQNVAPAREKVFGALEQLKPVEHKYTDLQKSVADRVARAQGESGVAGQKVADVLASQRNVLTESINQRVAQEQAKAREAQGSARAALQTLSGITTGKPISYEQWLASNNIDPNEFNDVIARTGNRDLANMVNQRNAALAASYQQAVNDGRLPLVGGSNPAAELTDQQLSTLGIDRGAWNNLISNYLKSPGGINPTDYLTTTDPANIYNVNNVATPQEAARYQALARLSGIDSPTLTPSGLTKPLSSPLQFDIASANATLQQQVAQREAQNQQQIQMQQLVDAQRQAASKSCFVAGTPVVMEDGSLKAVDEITIGDRVLLGGLVIGHGVNLEAELYDYRGTVVAGSHATFEDGSWIRVRDSQQATRINTLQDEGFGPYHKVYPIVTERHLMVVGDFISSDFAELDNKHDLTDDQRIDTLNNMIERNAHLINILITVFPQRYDYLKQAA